MSSLQVRLFIKSLGLKGRTLEVGSQDINGQVRDMFTDYVGLDLVAGPNVDVAASAHDLPFADCVFENVICLETIEHDQFFWLSVPEMLRVLKPGGIFAMSVPGFFMPPHGDDVDFWRFSTKGVEELLLGCGYLDQVRVEEKPNGLYLAARHKIRRVKGKIVDIQTTWCSIGLNRVNNYLKHGFTILPIYGIFAVGRKKK